MLTHTQHDIVHAASGQNKQTGTSSEVVHVYIIHTHAYNKEGMLNFMGMHEAIINWK